MSWRSSGIWMFIFLLESVYVWTTCLCRDKPASEVSSCGCLFWSRRQRLLKTHSGRPNWNNWGQPPQPKMSLVSPSLLQEEGMGPSLNDSGKDIHFPLNTVSTNILILPRQHFANIYFAPIWEEEEEASRLKIFLQRNTFPCCVFIFEKYLRGSMKR